ncbi:IclR family transcriptional regulator [Actinoallomurus oryzae]|uniref:IclR family transcriptional regulator n=1 Tax=Actinoallomurus oryzae TaxID=502180 RepID=A0ABP8PQR5_9ACTN
METRPSRQSGAGSAGGPLGKAFDVVFAMPPGGAEIGLSDLSRRAGLSKSTVHRILTALVRRGVVERSGTSYRLGEPILTLMPPRFDRRLAVLRDHLLPHLRRLARATGCPVFLDAPFHGELLCLEHIAGNNPARADGDGAPDSTETARRTTVARLLLPPRPTPGTVPSVFGPLVLGPECAAAPVVSDGRIVAALSVMFPPSYRRDGVLHALHNVTRAANRGLDRTLTG